MKKKHPLLFSIIQKYYPFFRFLFFAMVSAFLAWKGQIYIHGNEKAIDLIINVFSILTGFLIAILTLFSEIEIEKNANWRKLTSNEIRYKQRYKKHSLLFYTYLLTLIFIFLSILLGNNNKCISEEIKSSLEKTIISSLEYIYLWSACISIIYSAFLPSRLIQIRSEHSQRILENKKPRSRS